PHRTRLRERHRLRWPDPPRSLHVPRRGPRSATGLRPERPSPVEGVRGPLLRRRLPRRDDHHRHVADRARQDRARGEDRARRGGPVELGGGGGGLRRGPLSLLVAGVLLLASCAKKTPPAPPPPPPPTLTETPLPESRTAEFRIGPIN